MSGYIKKIAVIKQVKSGFSADGNQISGLVKAETYAGFLKVGVSLINFAPLSEGKYVFGICDGLNTVVFEGNSFEGESDFNLSSGFAFLVCFLKGEPSVIASAACGQMACALPDLKEEMRRREVVVKKESVAKKDKDGVAYDDEAITEVNYYDRNQIDESGVAVCENKEKKEEGADCADEADSGAVEGKKKRVEKEELGGGLAGGDYFSRMREDVEKIFAVYPKIAALEAVMEGSRFARIDYGEGKHYAFGVLYVEGKPRYICYGVPSSDGTAPPKSLKGLSSFVPCGEGGSGYWIMYQDAQTGVSVSLFGL